jgi:hypothetical protein
MTMFGYEEVIRPLSMSEVESEKTKYLYGQPHGSVKKHSATSKPADLADATRIVLAALKALYDGKSDYTAIELFTNPREAQAGCSTINVCTMRREK